MGGVIMYGLTFKGLHSNDFNLTMQSNDRAILSDVVRQTQFIQGFGTVDFGTDTYNENPLSVKFIYCANSLEDLRAQMELIGGWLYNDGQYYDLIFDDAPNRKYKAKVISKVDVSKIALVGILTVEFNCNPGYPFALDNSPVSPADVQKRLLWDTARLDGIQYLQDFAANGTVDFTVGGTQSVKPVIKLIGTIKSGFKLTYGTQIWEYDSDIIFDGIKIDCFAQIVTKMSDGSSLFDYVNETNYAYFELAIGQQSINISGVNGDLTIAVEFTPQYGG